MAKRAPACVLVAGLIALTACSAGSSAGSSPARSTSSGKAAESPAKVTANTDGTTSSGVGIHKIKHVIIIVQENRSFDSYFGTFPGADGIPMKGGKPAV